MLQNASSQKQNQAGEPGRAGACGTATEQSRDRIERGEQSRHAAAARPVRRQAAATRKIQSDGIV